MQITPETQKNESTRKQRSFKNILINPRYQMKYIFWLTGTGLLLVLANTLIFYRFTRENYDLLVDLSPITADVRTQLYSELNHIVLILGACSLAFLVIVSLLGILFSHRTAGPLYHFKKVFKKINDGDKAARVRLRPTDDFQDVAAEFNKMMDHLKQ